MARILRLELNGLGVFRDDQFRGIAAIDRAIQIAVAKRGGRWPEIESWEGSLSPYRHPTPSSDVPEWMKIRHRDDEEAATYFCGFRSLEQLLAWFDSEAVRDALNEVGCRMVEFEVSDEHVLHGKAQVMFLKEKATEIGRGPVPTLAH